MDTELGVANTEDAERLLVKWMREPPQTDYSSYGYDIFLPNLIRTHLRAVGRREEKTALQELSVNFYAAAWELCRRGILRPGVRVMGLQATDEGSGGGGYSITPFGRQWLEESDQDDYVPTEPGRFAEMLSPFQSRFGAQFKERSQEAIRCYGAHAYLACCVMCGAAAESILLATATEKQGDRDAVLKMYNTSQGRGRVENLILGSAKDGVRREFSAYQGLIKYWRDQASHGMPVQIGDNEAYTSLALLLRFAMFVEQRWESLTSPIQN